MYARSIMGLFCEDVREETGGVITLIGLLPDNINVAQPPKGVTTKGAIPFTGNRTLTKLSIFVRANFDPDDPIQRIQSHLVLPTGQEIDLGEASPELIEKSKRDAKEKQNPLAGITLRAQLSTLSSLKLGIMKLEVTIDAERQLLAALNFKSMEPVTSSSVPPQPS